MHWQYQIMQSVKLFREFIDNALYSDQGGVGRYLRQPFRARQEEEQPKYPENKSL